MACAGFETKSGGSTSSNRANTECVGECRDRRLAAEFTSASLASPRLALIARYMNTPTHEFVSVDMRGLKAALVTRARTERVSLSVLVRRAVESELGLVASRESGAVDQPATQLPAASVKLSIRLTSTEAQQLVSGARRAGLSRGAYLAGLLAGAPSLADGSASRPDHLAALNASCAELSTLSRNLHHLTALLRQGQVRPALEYRAMLDTIGGDVRQHLQMAASLLAELRPLRRPDANA